MKEDDDIESDNLQAVSEISKNLSTK